MISLEFSVPLFICFWTNIQGGHSNKFIHNYSHIFEQQRYLPLIFENFLLYKSALDKDCCKKSFLLYLIAFNETFLFFLL
jgi:hypothetical protein